MFLCVGFFKIRFCSSFMFFFYLLGVLVKNSSSVTGSMELCCSAMRLCPLGEGVAWWAQPQLDLTRVFRNSLLLNGCAFHERHIFVSRSHNVLF